MKKVYCATVAWRSVEGPHMQCVLQLCTHPEVRYRLKYGDALIDRARAQVATHFLLETDDDVLVTIDSDIAFPAGAVLEIAEQARTHDCVAGVYMTRSGEMTRPSSIFEQDVPMPFGQSKEPVPIRWAASGFLAMHRRVFEKLAEGMELCHPTDDPKEKAITYPFYPFYTPFVAYDHLDRPIYLSEDYAVCERARQAGFGIFANPAVELIHFGNWGYRVADILLDRPPAQPVTLTRTADGYKHGYDIQTFDPADAADATPESMAVQLSRAQRRHPERHGLVLAHK